MTDPNNDADENDYDHFATIYDNGDPDEETDLNYIDLGGEA